MDVAAFRARFPVLRRLAYLNAGTDGPVPAEAAEAARAELERQAERGRFGEHFERRVALGGELRAAYAGLVGAAVEDVALTTSTSQGLGIVIGGWELAPGDEILTAEHEHPGLIGPLIAARERGARIRTAPLTTLADHVRPETKLVACSHVGWVSGDLAPVEALVATGVPVVLDGAQGAGAIPVDVGALGCTAYAASGQKWLCGADGTGFLWLAAGLAERLPARAASYVSFVDAGAGLDGELKLGAARHDTSSLSAESMAFSATAFRVLAEAGWDDVHARARASAATLAARLEDRGRTVAPRGDTTLVAWEDDDPEATRDRLGEAGVVIRNLPRTPYVRASVGAWTSDEDLERLLEAL